MVERERLSELNAAPEQRGGYVLYWMQQSQRAVFNPALEVAIVAANRLHLPLVVGFGLLDSLPHAKARHYAFMLQGLAKRPPPCASAASPSSYAAAHRMRSSLG